MESTIFLPTFFCDHGLGFDYIHNSNVLLEVEYGKAFERGPGGDR